MYIHVSICLLIYHIYIIKKKTMWDFPLAVFYALGTIIHQNFDSKIFSDSPPKIHMAQIPPSRVKISNLFD